MMEDKFSGLEKESGASKIGGSSRMISGNEPQQSGQIYSLDNLEGSETSERFFRNLFELSPIPKAILDPETLNFIAFNNALLQDTGYSRDELSKMNIRDLFVAATANDFSSAVERVFSVGYDKHATYHGTKSEGRRPCELYLYSLELAHRKVICAVIEDTTQRLSIEESLSKSESQYRSLIENSPDIIMEVDPTGTILYANRVLKGSLPEHAIGSNLLDYIPSGYHEIVRKSLHRAYTRKKNTSYEISIVMPSGTRWWSTRILPLKKDGYLNKFIFIITDITSNKRAEEITKLSEERYRNLVEKAPLPIVITHKGVFIYANPNAIKALGFKHLNELLGRHYLDLVHPDDRFRLKNKLSAIYNHPDQSEHAEARMITQNGDRNFTFTSILIKYENETAGLTVLNDITDTINSVEALKASERKYRLLTENMRDAVWMMDFNWKHLYISPSIEQIRGFTADEVMDLPIEKSLPSHAIENAQKMLGEALATCGIGPDGKPMTATFEQEEYCKDGSTVWTEVRASMARDEEGNPIGIMGITRDITERRRTEALLKQSEEQYRNLVEYLPLPIAIIRDRKYVYLNAISVIFHNAPAMADLVGRDPIDFVHSDSKEKAIGMLDNLVKTPDEPQRGILRVENIDGVSIIINLTAINLMFDGETAQMVIYDQVPDDTELSV
jgi:PAS domain S-box-containing protein